MSVKRSTLLLTNTTTVTTQKRSAFFFCQKWSHRPQPCLKSYRKKQLFYLQCVDRKLCALQKLQLNANFCIDAEHFWPHSGQTVTLIWTENCNQRLSGRFILLTLRKWFHQQEARSSQYYLSCSKQTQSLQQLTFFCRSSMFLRPKEIFSHPIVKEMRPIWTLARHHLKSALQRAVDLNEDL